MRFSNRIRLQLRARPPGNSRSNLHARLPASRHRARRAGSQGFHIEACAPRAPEQKGKVEAKVRMVRRLIEPLGTRFDGLEDLQAQTDERVERWCERAICPATGKSVRESWEHERELLRPLPLLPEPFDVTVIRPVHRDCMVHFEQRQYAVPFEHVGGHIVERRPR